MKAFVIKKPGQAGLTEVDKPAPPAGEVLIKVAAAGFCGTDIHTFPQGIAAYRFLCAAENNAAGDRHAAGGRDGPGAAHRRHHLHRPAARAIRRFRRRQNQQQDYCEILRAGSFPVFAFRREAPPFRAVGDELPGDRAEDIADRLQPGKTPAERFRRIPQRLVVFILPFPAERVS